MMRVIEQELMRKIRKRARKIIYECVCERDREVERCSGGCR